MEAAPHNLPHLPGLPPKQNSFDTDGVLEALPAVLTFVCVSCVPEPRGDWSSAYVVCLSENCCATGILNYSLVFGWSVS
jgi:hypothetical protein